MATKPHEPSDHIFTVWQRIRAAKLEPNELAGLCTSILRRMEDGLHSMFMNFEYPEEKPTKFLRNRRAEIKEYEWLLDNVQALRMELLNKQSGILRVSSRKRER